MLQHPFDCNVGESPILPDNATPLKDIKDMLHVLVLTNGIGPVCHREDMGENRAGET